MNTYKASLKYKALLILALCLVSTVIFAQMGLSATPTNPGINSSCVSANCHADNTHDNHYFYDDCMVCHYDKSAEVRSTLAFGLDCTGCHTEAHLQRLTHQFPAQIPLYPDFKWSNPAPYLTFKGDGWTLRNGTIYDQRMMIFSNSGKDVDLNTVLNWYKTALTNNGWTGLSPTLATDYFKLHANLETEGKVTVWMYKNGTYGWAIRIIYGAYTTI